MSKRSEIKPLLSLAAPVTLSFLANMIMQIVDTYFVGKLGPHAIGCVSIGNALFFTFMVVGMGTTFGLDFLVSHAFGAKKIDECHKSFIQALYVSTAVSVLFGVMMVFFAFHLDWLGIEASLVTGSKNYLIILALSLWPFLVFSSSRQYLQAMGVATPILYVLAASNIVNALGNYIFVWGNWGFKSYGVEGSGWSTVFARFFMVGCTIAYILYRDRKKKLGLTQTSFQFERILALKLLKLGLPAAVQLLLEVGVFSTVTILCGRLGAEVLSAHQVVLHIASTAFMVPLGLSIAAAVRIGQALGAQNFHRVSKIGWVALLIAIGWMVFSATVLTVFSKQLISVFSQDQQVLLIGQSLILIVALFQVSDGIQVTATGILRGVADTKTPMVANLIGHWLIGLPIGAFLCFKLGWGAKGLWVGLCIGLSFVALTLIIVWNSKSRKTYLSHAA